MCRWRFDGLWILEHLSIFLILSIFKMDEKDLKPIGHGKRWGYTSMGICEGSSSTNSSTKNQVQGEVPLQIL